MGAYATRQALADAGVRVEATCSSPTAAAWPTMLPGSEGSAHGRHARRTSSASPACSSSTWRTAAPPPAARWPRPCRRSRRASSTSAWPSASTSTRAATSTPTRPRRACGQWYGDLGFMVTTQFFAMKINRYLHDHDISHDDAGEGGGQGLPQRRAQPERLAPEADQRGGDPRVAAAQPPAHAVHALLARRGRGRGGRVPGRPGPPLHRRARCFVRGVAVRTRRFGTFEVFSAVAVDRARPRAPRSTRPGPCTSRPGIGPGRRAGRPAPGQRVGRRDHAHGRERLLRRRRAGAR